MKITNKLGLPQSFVEMATRDYELEPYEYRVTSLLKGVREAILERRYHEQIEQDVSDMIWLLFGTAVHNVLDHQTEEDCEIKESRVKIPIGDYTLSGQFDLYNAETQTVTDYKTASVWKVIYENYDDWRKQLLIYAYMLRSIGFPVKQGEIIAILKDHSKRDAKNKAGYPELPVKKLTFSFSEEDYAEIEAWLEAKFEKIAEAEKLPDDQLPLCTPEERFNSGDKFAVMKNGRKTALRVLDSMEEAGEWMTNNKGDFVEIRPGEDKKCADYCSVCDFCSYYRQAAMKSV